MEPVPGTGFGLAIFGSPPTTSGPSVGSLGAGMAAIVVALLVACFGLSAAASEDQTASSLALVGGAFAVLAGFLGVAGVGLGLAGLRQHRRARPAEDGPVRGRGLAIAGIACGGVGLVITACSIGAAVLAAAS